MQGGTEGCRGGALACDSPEHCTPGSPREGRFLQRVVVSLLPVIALPEMRRGVEPSTRRDTLSGWAELPIDLLADECSEASKNVGAVTAALPWQRGSACKAAGTATGSAMTQHPTGNEERACEKGLLFATTFATRTRVPLLGSTGDNGKSHLVQRETE